MANLSITEIMAIIGNKELIIVTKDKEIQSLQIRIKQLEDKYEPQQSAKGVNSNGKDS